MRALGDDRNAATGAKGREHSLQQISMTIVKIDVDKVQFESENWFAKYFIAFLFRWVCLYFSGAYAYDFFFLFNHII